MTFLGLTNFLDRGNDLTSFFWPQAYFLKESILKGTFPLWQTQSFSGMPLVGDPQNLSFYPPNVLLLFLPLNLAFLFLFIAHLIFAAISCFLLVKRSFKQSNLAALLAALAYTFSPIIFSHLEAGHYTMIIAFSWLPLLFFVFLSFLKKPAFKKVVFIALILTMIFMNYVNIFYFSFIFLALWLVIEKPRVLKFLPLIALLALGLSSFQLLPQLELSQLSNRAALGFEDVAIPVWSFRLFAQSLVFPYWYGIKNFGTENLLFPGWLVGILGAVGFLKLKGRRRWLFGIWLVFSLLYSLGARIPFFIFFYKYVSLIKFMRVTTRLWIISILIIALLAGIGLERLRKKFRLSSRVVWFLVFLVIAELLFIDLEILKRESPAAGPKVPPEAYQLIKADQEKFRIYCTTDCLSIKEAVKIGKPILGGNNPVQLKDYVKFLAQAAGYQYDKYIPVLPPYGVFPQKAQPDAQLLGLLNTKYVLSPYPLEDEGFVLQEKFEKIFVYQNNKALGQAFLERKQETIPLEIKYCSPNKIAVQLEPKLEGKLVLSEVFYPGWQAEIDGRETEIKKAYQVLRSIEVPKGSNEAVFIYAPKSFFLGIGISLLTLAIIVILTSKSKL